MYNNSVDIVLAHGYNDLFPKGAFGDHADLRTYFLIGIVCNIVHFDNFIVNSLEKASFIFNMSFILPLVACAKNLIFL